MDFLFWAYTIVWILLFGYFIRLASRQNKLLKEVRQLQNRLDEIEKQNSDNS